MRASAAIHFAWAMINFMILVQYHLHDKEILQYLEHALFQLKKLKNVFHHLQSECSDTDVNHFNISKLHVMTYYASQIWKYDNADNFNTKHSEIVHKYLIKIFLIASINKIHLKCSYCITILDIWIFLQWKIFFFTEIQDRARLTSMHWLLW
jgi:hypothetical protein